MLLGKIDLRFADESAFNQTSNVPYGWMRKGEQYGIRSSKYGQLNVFGLLNYRGELTSYTTSKNVNGEQIVEWLDDFSGSLSQPTVVVLDNASWHTCAAVTAKLSQWEDRGMFLFFLPPYRPTALPPYRPTALPPYCPHLNVIEILWRKMKHEWLRPQDYNSKEALHDRINEILDKYNEGLFSIEFDLDKILT